MRYTKKRLEEMIKSENWVIRQAVAEQGYRLDVLINDEHWAVRKEVAKQGYGLEKLIFDKYCRIREIAIDRLQELVEQGKVEVIIREK